MNGLMYTTNDISWEQYTNAGDNRTIDEINKGKLSDVPLHLEFRRFKLTKDDKQKMKEMNLSVKEGMFTKEEDVILTRNWHQFCDNFIVDNPHTVLGFFSQSFEKNSSERKSIKELIKRSELYLRLAKDLPDRTLNHVYQRARRLFSGLKKSKNLTEEERKEIIKLGHNGHKTSEIAERFLADIRTVDEVLRRNINCTKSESIKKKRWTEEEDLKMQKIISQFFVETDSPLKKTSEIPWSVVAGQMRNRSDHQCREHFETSLFFQTYDPTERLIRFSRLSSQKLVYFLYHRNYENESDIDWEEIKESCRFSTIMRNWNRIKRKIEDYEFLEWSTLIQRIYTLNVENKKYHKIIKQLEEFYDSKD